MRTLVIFRGAPGVGKSTFIAENGLTHYTVSADSLRLLFGSPELSIDGFMGISQKNDKDVWNRLFDILERRMQNGDFTVVDATNSKTSEMNRYKELCHKYRYRIICVDMTNIPIEIAKERNNNRLHPIHSNRHYKYVPEHVIDTMYERFKTNKIPSGIEVVTCDELMDKIQYKSQDVSNYKKIHHFGDLHGCYSVLEEYFQKNPFKDDELYVFTGDYVDRGIEHEKLLNFLFSIMHKSNVIFLEGNHEAHLWHWANDEESKSPEFNKHTTLQLNNVDKKEARIFYRKLRQVFYYTHNVGHPRKQKNVIITHAGISSIPTNLTFIPTSQFINGVGRYEDMKAVNDFFVENTVECQYQIHGHRNVFHEPIKINDRCYCLESEIEFGGNFRVVTLDNNGFEEIEIKNEVWNKERYKNQAHQVEVPKTMNDKLNDVIKSLKNNKHIIEKHFDNGVSSFNFSRQVFWDKIWNDLTTKARGLFVNMNTGKIVCRSYEKFFNIGENSLVTMESLKKNLVFPVTAYNKYNGFLGMLGVHDETGEALFASKSSFDSDFANYFKDIFMEKHGSNFSEIVKFIKENNVTLVFEVIDIKNDPHIIKYDKNSLVLLDVVYNDITFKKFSYSELCKFAFKYNLVDKQIHCNQTLNLSIFNNFQEFEQFVIDAELGKVDEHLEGVVFEDSNGFNVKLKFNYYKFWKFMRSVKGAVVRHGAYKNPSVLTDTFARPFYEFVLKYNRDNNEELAKMSIIECREKFLENYKGKK